MTDIQDDEPEVAYLDVYMRFNNDMEKDYCFQVKTTTAFKDLYKVFDTLPLSLRPSVFYHAKPIGFRKSTSPGYLTEDGNIVFDDDSQDQSAPVDDNDLINEKVWPGQLILPVWEFNDFGFYSFITFLLVWLYTDLPDFISPTPGLCLTNQMTKFLCWAVTQFGKDDLAEIIIKDLYEPVSVGAQIAFFVFHLIKVLFIFGVFWTGIFNPIRLFRLSPKSVKLEVTKDELIKLGWTGTRKATIEEYKEYYREFKIKQHGGMIQAHRAGVFETLKNLGAQLESGEGYSTPMTEENKLRPMKEIIKEAKEPGFKLRLSYEYFAELGYVFAVNAEDKEGPELTELIKQYIRYGLLVSDARIKAVVKGRKGELEAEAPAKVEEIVEDDEKVEN
ncbi:Glucose-signaling factor 2 [Candida viswanathii]|uniref:Glucose-signaling factor 2 n=1 Tax=Candida viswanathii TaxID=5486 RepID=A0A367Y3W3_9ASCO|nr:Glucose-signaling factor 2 [Candida viswanathii]